MRLILCAGVLLTATAWAQRPVSPVECDDNFSECREDCAISFGGTTNLKMRAKLTPCLNKCNKVELECREQFFETKRNNLDEGAISKVDSDGVPIKKKEERKPDTHDEELRREEAAPAPAAEEKEQEKAAPPKEEPRSNRTQITTVDPKEKKKAEPKPEPKPEVVVRDEPPPPRREEPKKAEEPKPEPKKKEEKRRPLDEWDPDAL